MDFKDYWNIETALRIVQNKTVDSQLWAEAVEWLLLYGPPEIVSVLLQASGQATEQCFPDLQTAQFTSDGMVCYDISQLARSLGIPEEEVRQILSRKTDTDHAVHFYGTGGSTTVH